MTRYAKGTPSSVMKASDKKFYGTKVNRTAPLPTMTPKIVVAPKQKTPVPLPAMQQPMQQPRTKRGLGSAFMAKGGAVKKVVKANMAKGGAVKAVSKKKK